MRKSLSLFLKTKKAANRDSITSKVFGDGGVEDGRGEEGPFSRKVPPPLPNSLTAYCAVVTAGS